MVEFPPETDRPTLPHSPPPELLASLRLTNAPTRRLSAVTVPSPEELADVDDGWFAMDDRE
jgi:hypothetical protein